MYFSLTQTILHLMQTTLSILNMLHHHAVHTYVNATIVAWVYLGAPFSILVLRIVEVGHSVLTTSW